MIKKQQTGNRLVQGILATGLLVSAPLTAQENPVGIEAAATEILRQSMTYLGNLPEFSLQTHSTIEVVLQTGQKIQYDYDIAATVVRPNKLHAKRLGELSDDEFFYDGKNLSLYYPEEDFFATVEAPPTIDKMLDFAMQELDIVAPAADFIYANAYELLMEGVHTAFVVAEPAYLDGVICDHLAFSAPGTDFQVWVERGDRPLPHKLVITSRDILNAPQYTVYIQEWNLDPDVSDEIFHFKAPESASRIEFITLNGDAD